jgi:hypothetical protein
MPCAHGWLRCPRRNKLGERNAAGRDGTAALGWDGYLEEMR